MTDEYPGPNAKRPPGGAARSAFRFPLKTGKPSAGFETVRRKCLGRKTARLGDLRDQYMWCLRLMTRAGLDDKGWTMMMRSHAVTHTHLVSVMNFGMGRPLMSAVTFLDDNSLGGGRHRERNSQTDDQQINLLRSAPFLQSGYKLRAAFAFREERLLARAAMWRDDAGGFQITLSQYLAPERG